MEKISTGNGSKLCIFFVSFIAIIFLLILVTIIRNNLILALFFFFVGILIKEAALIVRKEEGINWIILIIFLIYTLIVIPLEAFYGDIITEITGIPTVNTWLTAILGNYLFEFLPLYLGVKSHKTLSRLLKSFYFR